MNLKALQRFRDNFYAMLKRNVYVVNTMRCNIAVQEMIIEDASKKLSAIGNMLPKITLEQTKEIEDASIAMRTARAKIAGWEDDLANYEAQLGWFQSLCEHNDIDEGFCSYCSAKMYKEQL